MFENTTPSNLYAFGLFILAKAAAMGGIALGFSSSLYWLGGVLLVLSAVTLGASIYLCIREMKRQNAEEEAEKIAAREKRSNEEEVLQSMLDDGRLFKEMAKRGFRLQRSPDPLDRMFWN